MGRPDDSGTRATICIGPLEFPALLSRSLLRRLELPDIADGINGCREMRASMRIDSKEKPGPDDEDCIRLLAGFLESVMSGVEPLERPQVDLSELSPFAREVLDAVARIPWGETRSYRWVAEQVEKPGASRAVGGAVGRNPVPLLVPCHRVVRSDGAIGGWSGKQGWKEWLIENETK